MGTMEDSGVFIIDEEYEFSAPRFYDFIDGESVEDTRKAEHWFTINASYAPSPPMPSIKSERKFQVESLCDFSEAELSEKESSESNVSDIAIKSLESEKQEAKKNVKKESTMEEICTPVPVTIARTNSKKHQDPKKLASLLKNPSALRSKEKLQQSQAKSSRFATVKRDVNVKNTALTPNVAQDNQAIKRQKLDYGKARQIVSIKTQNLPHKTKTGLINSSTITCPSSVKVKPQKDDRTIYMREREKTANFVSTSEMIKKFQSSTRDLSIPGTAQKVPPKQLTLTRPKEPDFETSQRARPVKVKSSAELEEEMMANIPKFKARPLIKKILKAPTLPALPRSTPQLPEFKEFNLETMSRANQNAESSFTVESSQKNYESKPHYLTTPKTPFLQTQLRARPNTTKTSSELEIEELEKFPKFKAKPLNKKIFESKGEFGIFCNTKRQITIPQEFNFALDQRIPLQSNVEDLFDKLSLNNTESNHSKHNYPKNTTPSPFHLYTEERGAEKERRLAIELEQKRINEEKARVPKATPYPYTTDYPVVPPKPDPKPCTKPEPFPLESVARHEEEMLREMEERRRIEIEEARMRLFKAQPILKEDPIPLPEKSRIPLTEVEAFNLHVEHRAVDRAEFDMKIKEKEEMYKRYREEAEAERMMEEEKALKQLRRRMVPHARPVPDFHRPFLPQRSMKEVTKATSPRLHVLRRQERRKMCSPMAASNMR